MFSKEKTMAIQAHGTKKVWKTIMLGTGIKNAAGFRKSLRAGGYQIRDWANDILGKQTFSVSDTQRAVELILVTPRELGFPHGGGRSDVYKRAQEIGLELCPPEVGPQLRLQYTDQPMNEWIFIGMEPIADSRGDPSLFYVQRTDYCGWLGAHTGRPDSVLYGGVLCVFLRRTQSLVT